MPAARTPADEEFLSRFGDVIDDRIAEILDELLEERNARPRHRLDQPVAAGDPSTHSTERMGFPPPVSWGP